MKKRIIALSKACLSVYVFALMSYMPLCATGKVSKAVEAIGAVCSETSSHFPALALLRCLAHAPEIALADSVNPRELKITSGLAALASGAKVSHELAQRPILLLSLIYNIPKSLAYSISLLYDGIKLMDAQTIASRNQKALDAVHPSLKNYKQTQLLKLGAEAGVRLAAALSHYTTYGNETTTYLLSELADWLEIWRLLGRFVRYQELSNADLAPFTDEEQEALNALAEATEEFATSEELEAEEAAPAAEEEVVTVA